MRGPVGDMYCFSNTQYACFLSVVVLATEFNYIILILTLKCIISIRCVIASLRTAFPSEMKIIMLIIKTDIYFDIQDIHIDGQYTYWNVLLFETWRFVGLNEIFFLLPKNWDWFTISSLLVASQYLDLKKSTNVHSDKRRVKYYNRGHSWNTD